jgi:hypothetical protein
VELPCGPVFGYVCIVKQTEVKVQNHNRCPLCRQELFEQDFDEYGSTRFDVSDSEEEGADDKEGEDEDEDDEVVEQTQEEYEAQVRISAEDNRPTIATDGDELSTVERERPTTRARGGTLLTDLLAQFGTNSGLPPSRRRIVRMSAPSQPSRRRARPARRSNSSLATRRSGTRAQSLRAEALNITATRRIALTANPQEVIMQPSIPENAESRAAKRRRLNELEGLAPGSLGLMVSDEEDIMEQEDALPTHARDEGRRAPTRETVHLQARPVGGNTVPAGARRPCPKAMAAPMYEDASSDSADFDFSSESDEKLEVGPKAVTREKDDSSSESDSSDPSFEGSPVPTPQPARRQYARSRESNRRNYGVEGVTLHQLGPRPWDESSSLKHSPAYSAESEYEADDDEADAEDEREEKRVYRLLPGEAPRSREAEA